MLFYLNLLLQGVKGFKKNPLLYKEGWGEVLEKCLIKTPPTSPWKGEETGIDFV
jgi:hypothetical protein